MIRKLHKTNLIILFLALPLILAACNPGGETPAPEEEVTTLIYANLTEGGVDRQAVDKFNSSHEDVQIEVRDYFDEENSSGRSGRDRLLTEIGAGKFPDIIDLGRRKGAPFISQLPYEMLVSKGYLEDLWPYIENDPELGWEGVVEAPLKAAEVNGGLYMIFNAVTIYTMVGAEDVVGDRHSWTIADMQETLASMPEDSTVMEFYLNKDDVFHRLMSMSLDNYVDWDTGECFFTGDKFRSVLEFINSFPDESPARGRTREESMEATEEMNKRLREGRQMTTWQILNQPLEIQYLDAVYGGGGKASFVGCPMEDGSVGSSFSVGGRALCMSSTCQDKEAAWEFLRQEILPKYTTLESMYEGLSGGRTGRAVGIPVNRADYEMIKLANRSRCTINYDFLLGETHKATQEEVGRFDDLVNSIDKLELQDGEIYDIVFENVSAYFAGDKTLDETCDLIQRRVQLYVDEMR